LFSSGLKWIFGTLERRQEIQNRPIRTFKKKRKNGERNVAWWGDLKLVGAQAAMRWLLPPKSFTAGQTINHLCKN
jgi:hypothetical protein